MRMYIAGMCRTLLILGLSGGLLLAGCGSPETETPAGPDIRGAVTAITPAGEGQALGTLRIEGGRQADTRFDKAVVTVTRGSRIRQEGGGELTFQDLALGDRVEARFEGPVRESFPVQADAAEIVLVSRLGRATVSAAPLEEAGDTAPKDFSGGTDEVVKPDRGQGIAVLRDVRTGPQEGFDRAVFEFEADPLPGYQIRYADRPVHCGSGLPAEVAGTVWLEVRLRPAQAHNEQGGTTVGTLERKLDLKALKELQATCDFEADVTWVLGLDQHRPYRVLELTDPPRLVVDVKR